MTVEHRVGSPTDVFDHLASARERFAYEPATRERGEIVRLTEGVARVSGLPGVGYEELRVFFTVARSSWQRR